MLLDTGSAYNLIDNTAAGALGAARPLTLAAAGGSAEARLLPGRVAVESAGRELIFERAVATDLADMGRRNGIAVAGVIGFPALAHSVLTINYRDSLVSIQPKSWKVAMSR
jgi:hypothetical protein